ncbi:MAG: PKD domain-containing protein [Acidimicrobiia bacterium]|nr:PKD domain-containing protein [Acidimicrobiia bacterium]MDX2466588.1 PKD domain-containing protein [Acidimicrobiia bacterium]
MFDRIRKSTTSSPEAIGGLLVVIGLVMFILVFLVVYPVLSDPVGRYDKWFPEDEEASATVVSVDEETDTANGPTAAFRFVAEPIRDEDLANEGEEGAEFEEPQSSYQVSFEDRSEPGDTDIASWAWDLGDGSEKRGAFVEHTYEGPGVYSVLLSIEDESGGVDKVEGDIEIPEEGRSFGRVESEEDLDLSGIESAVEDAVVTLEESVDETLDSVGSAARSAVIVVLFALAAITATVVAWRVTRSGIMLLRPAEKLRLKVKSADMRVDIGKDPIEDVIADRTQDAVRQEEDTDPALVEV